MNRKLRQMICAGFVAAAFAAVTIPAGAATVTDFTDVSPDAWYYTAVDYAASEELFAGAGTNTFSPDMGMTRGMFVTVLGRKNGVDKAAYPDSRFTDVKPGDWYAPYVEWAAEYGIVSGVGKGKFDPNGSITREQMAKILYGYAQLTGNDTSTEESRYTAFPDTGKVSGYAAQGMKWAVSHGIIKGSDGKLNPQGTATRAQVAQVFLNAQSVLVNTEITEQPEKTPETDIPTIELTAEQRAMLTDEQDPDEVVRQIVRGTNAKWDDDLTEADGFYMDIMLFGFTPNEMYTTSHAVFNTLEYLNDTGADRFRIVVFNDPSYILEGHPANGLQVIYTIPAKQDSALMAQVRKLVEKEFPYAIFTPDTIKTGSGWRGYMKADDELSLAENANRVARQEIEYLQEWYSPDQTFNYWLSEPTPGKVWFYY